MTNLLGILIIVSAFLMLVGAIWMLHSSKRSRFRERVITHFHEVLPNGATISGIPPGAKETYWHQLRVRLSIYAGFEMKSTHFVVIPTLFLGFGLLGWFAYGWSGAILFFGGALFVFGYLLPYNRLRRRQALVISQVPMFIDQVLRSLSTGRSLESSIRFATEESSSPLRHVLDRVIRATDLGADMVETLSDAASLHGLRELNLIALAMRISNNYGSSPKEMLESIVQMVRQQELARRELGAMTGETRISAWVLGLTPVAIAAYIMIVNPGYMNMMLEDDSGKTMLIAALCLQGFGGFILWRMLKSV